MRTRTQAQDAAHLPVPSLQAFKNALGGYISSTGVLRFPRPPGDDVKDHSCTLTLDPAGPDGFIVADGRKIIDGLELKDYVKNKVGLPPFSPASRRSNGVAKNHRPAGGPMADDHQTPGHSRIHLIPFGQIRLSERPRFVVDRFIPHVGLAVIWGEPKSGKSFLVFDMAMHVALGWTWRGLATQKGAVVYCAFEGQTGLEARVEAFKQRHMNEDHDAGNIPFYLMPVTINLIAEHQALIAAIRDSLGADGPALIVLDTLSRSLHGSEASDEDMASYVRATDALREAFGCAMAVVHHCGHNKDRPRGHTCLTGAADAVIAVKMEKNSGIFTAQVEMMKDGEPNAVVASRLESVTVGLDKDGRPITSCFVHAIDGTGASQPIIKLSDQAKIALQALQEVLIEHGETQVVAVGRMPAGSQTVAMDLWRQAAYAVIPTDSDKPDTKRQAFKRAYEKLQAAGIISIFDDLVWLTRHARHGQTGQQLSGPPLPRQTQTHPVKRGVVSGEAAPEHDHERWQPTAVDGLKGARA